MGTKLPWATDWIIESLSDSTIYMSYYTVIKDINRLKPDPEKLTEAFWDYVYLGEGDVEAVSETTGISVEELEAIRGQFSYFYPLDARHSGRYLISNHLTFMIFNHDAIFPRENWPRGIVVNGSVLMEGQKMSKSLNNIIPLATAIDRFGIDPLRLALMITAEPLKDADFSPELAKSMADNLERFQASAMEIAKSIPDENVELTDVDLWMLSRLQGYIKEANEAMLEMKVRRTIHAALYNLKQDLDWYNRRVEAHRERSERRRAIQHVLWEVMEAQVKLLTPFTPHLCEEIWEAMKNEPFVALEPWPKADEDMVRLDSEELESVIKASIEDVQKIVQVTGISPRRIHFYTADVWKWKVYLKALELSEAGRLDVGTLIRESFKDEEVKAHQDEVPAFARGVTDDVTRTPARTAKIRTALGIVNETRLIEDAASFFEAELGSEVTVASESDPWIHDPNNKASRSKPYRPAIYIE
jgi:leucyl-tRNA synthetase